MTTEEAIETVEYATAFNAENSKLTRALDIIISIARTQQEAEKNNPLTLEELRNMDGEPVWVMDLEKEKKSCYRICYLDGVKRFYLMGKSTIGYLPEEYGGETWLAYRHKPKEVRENE